MKARRSIGLALLAACVLGLVVWWSMGGQEATGQPRRGAHEMEHARGGPAPVALVPAGELAAAERAVEARASLDDRRAWSATLAFAPDMAWLAPQLVWRVRAAGGESHDVMERLAALPLDTDGDGAIELALRAPPAREAERVVVDLHLGDVPDLPLATLDVPGSGAFVSLDWADVPLVAAGCIRSHGVTDLQLIHDCTRDADGDFSLPDVPKKWYQRPVCVACGVHGEFALFGQSSDGPRPPSLWLECNGRLVSSRVPITDGRTDHVLEVDRGEVRVALLLDPAFEYPGMVLRVDDASGAKTSWPLDELRSGAASSQLPVVVEAALACGPATLAISHTRLANQPIEGASRSPLRFDVPRGASVEIPIDGPLDVHAQPDVAVLRLTAPSSARVTGSWECDNDYSSAFASEPAPEAEAVEVRSTSWALFVPSDARRLIVEAPGCRRVELDVWRGETREAVLEAIAPARVTVDWSACGVSGHGGEVDIQVWSHRVDRSVEPDAAFKTLAYSQFVKPMGFKDAMDVPLRDDVEIPDVFVRWKAPSPDVAQAVAQPKEVFLQVLDITSGGALCFEYDARGLRRRLRIESGRAYVIHVGDPLQSPR